MNPLLIEQVPTAEIQVPFSIRGERERMKTAFNAWLKCPAYLPRYEALRALMTEYELRARLRGVIPRQAESACASND